MAHRLVFFGNERLATGVTTDTPVLRGLLSDPRYEVVGIVVAQGEARPSRKQRALEIAAVAEEHSIKLYNFADTKQAIKELKQLDALAGILVAYGRIIPEDIIKVFPHGIINIHPSLLPKHRGP